MNFSKFHLNFANNNLLADSLDDPEKYFGPNYATLLNFWWFLTTLTPAQEEELDRITQLNRVFASKRLFVASAEASNASYTGSLNRNVFECCNNSMKKTEASHEIIGMHIILDLNESLKILPLFSNL
jgi:hypothetical protein